VLPDKRVYFDLLINYILKVSQKKVVNRSIILIIVLNNSKNFDVFKNIIMGSVLAFAGAASAGT
jgi:hypothetical protein